MTENSLVTVAQAARELKLSVRAVQRRIKRGALSATKIGDGLTSAYVMSRAELDRAKAEEAA